MLENNDKSTLELLQEEASQETNEYFDEQTGLDFSPEKNNQEETSNDEVSENIETSETEPEEIDFNAALEEFSSEDEVSEMWEYELPSLDPSLAENPVLLKRAQEYEKGVKKLINRVKEREEQLGDLTNLSEWNKALSDPETVKPALTHLVKELGRMYNLDLYDIIIDASSDTQSQDYSATTTQAEIDALVEAKVQEKLRTYEEDLSYVRSKKQKEETEQALDKYIKNVSTKTKKEIATSDNGWQITDEMIKEAVQALPNLVKDPVKAVRAYFSDERLAHFQKSSRSKDVAPTLTTKSNVGHNLPEDPSKIKAIDIIRMMQ